MTETIVAIYDDIVIARQVVEDLVHVGFERDSISLVTNDSNNHYSRYLDRDYVPRDDAVNASEGASFGAIVGGLGGLLVGLVALPIPGVGLAVAAGPIMAGLTGILFGVVTGGLVGALIKTGVPEDEAPYYAESIRRGGTLVSIHTNETLKAKDILNFHGAVNIHERVKVWKQDGWDGFNMSAGNNEVIEPIIEESPPLAKTLYTNEDTTIPSVPFRDEISIEYKDDYEGETNNFTH